MNNAARLGTVAGTAGLSSIARSNVVAGRSTTTAVSRTAMVNQSAAVRNNFYGANYNCFHGGWWAQYPGAWRAAAWTTAAAVWSYPAWGTCATYCGYAAEPVYSEFRDDHFGAAFDRHSKSQAVFSVAYVVRAVSPGTYVLPQAFVEDMYRPDRYGRTGTGTVVVAAAAR